MPFDPTKPTSTPSPDGPIIPLGDNRYRLLPGTYTYNESSADYNDRVKTTPFLGWIVENRGKVVHPKWQTGQGITEYSVDVLEPVIWESPQVEIPEEPGNFVQLTLKGRPTFIPSGTTLEQYWGKPIEPTNPSEFWSKELEPFGVSTKNLLFYGILGLGAYLLLMRKP